jgi:hypothetical protein
VKITFAATRSITYEFSLSGESLAEISGEMRRLKACEASGDCELRDTMRTGFETEDKVCDVKIIRRED